jgi:hypothetical protein
MTSTSDRYVQGDPTDPVEVVRAQFVELHRKVDDLIANPLGGSFISEDDFGNGLVYVGKLPDGTSRGLEIISAASLWDLVKMTTAGWIAPHLQGAPYDPAAQKLVTSGVFATQYAVLFGDYLGPGVEVMVPWATAAGTTGELQVVSNGGGTTATHALAANSSGFAFVRWLHGTPVGSGPFTVSVQARKTAGAGSIAIGLSHAWVQDPTLCSSGGTWV